MVFCITKIPTSTSYNIVPMKNLKLTQSLNQKVGIEIEETGLRPGTPGGPTCGQGAWHVGIAKWHVPVSLYYSN
jgi:hypothetical protein